MNNQHLIKTPVLIYAIRDELVSLTNLKGFSEESLKDAYNQNKEDVFEVQNWDEN